MSMSSDRKLLTSDKMPFMVMVFGFPAGMLFLLALLLGYGSYETFRALGRGAPDMTTVCTSTYPTVCAEESRREGAVTRAAFATAFLVASAALWQTGFRFRYVWLTDKKEIVVAWGARLPVTLRRYRAADLSGLTVIKELRYSLSPNGTSSGHRVNRAPDRWRLTASAGMKRANLGSFPSEAEANLAVDAIAKATRS